MCTDEEVGSATERRQSTVWYEGQEERLGSRQQEQQQAVE